MDSTAGGIARFLKARGTFFRQFVRASSGVGLFGLVLLGLFLLGCVQPSLSLECAALDAKDTYACLVSLAGKTGDPAYCERAPIVYESWCGPRGPLMGNCGRSVIGDPERCMTTVFSSNADPVFCANVSDDVLADSCFARLRNATDLAVSNRSDFFCDRIKNRAFFQGANPDLRGLCFKDLALYRNDSSVCGRIAFSGTHDDCYQALAVQLNEFELCDKTYHAQADCLTLFAIRLARADICERIPPDAYGDSVLSGRELCYLRLARPFDRAAANLTYCSGIQNPFGRYYQCMDVLNASQCDDLENVSDRDDCLGVVVYYREGDPGLCQRITSVTKRAECVQAISNR